MKKGWKIVLMIVIIAIAFGAVCAGVGALTGADADRIQSILIRRGEEKYNLDVQALFQVWLPEVVQIFRQELA